MLPRTPAGTVDWLIFVGYLMIGLMSVAALGLLSTLVLDPMP